MIAIDAAAILRWFCFWSGTRSDRFDVQALGGDSVAQVSDGGWEGYHAKATASRAMTKRFLRCWLFAIINNASPSLDFSNCSKRKVSVSSATAKVHSIANEDSASGLAGNINGAIEIGEIYPHVACEAMLKSIA